MENRKTGNGTIRYSTPENEPKLIGDVVSVLLATIQERVAKSNIDEREHEKTSRERTYAIGHLANQLGPRYAPERCDLAKYEIYHDKQKDALATVKKIGDGIETLIGNAGGVIFYGPIGTGKDYFLAWLMYQAITTGASCRWINGQEIFGNFRDRMDTGQRDEDFFRELATPRVLGISDPIPPMGQPGAWDIGNLYRLLERRYRAMKCTWVTINAMTLEEADDKLSGPIFDRLRHEAISVPCFWPSYRERKGC